MEDETTYRKISTHENILNVLLILDNISPNLSGLNVAEYNKAYGILDKLSEDLGEELKVKIPGLKIRTI